MGRRRRRERSRERDVPISWGRVKPITGLVRVRKEATHQPRDTREARRSPQDGF